MDEKIKSWWNSNKLLFFIALPLIILWFFKDLVFALLAGSARKTAEEAKKEDSKFQENLKKAELEAALAKAQADAAGKRAEDRKESDVSEDWHKK